MLSIMIYFRFVVCILLVKGLQTVKDAEVKVCQSDPVRLFCSIWINNDTIVSLYRITDEERLIATWSIQLNTTNGPKYSGRLSIDESNTLWILNVHLSDEGKYLLLQKEMEANSSSSSVVKLYVMLAPDTICKPNIKQLDYNIMRAYLEADSCGKPKVTVYWQEHDGVEYKGKDVAKLQSGMEKGTYYACIEGPALTCSRRSNQSSEHCSSITIKENRTEPDIRGNKDYCCNDDIRMLLVTILILLVMLLLGFTVAVLLYICKKIKTNSAPSGEMTTTTNRETTTTTNMTTSGILKDTLPTQSGIEATTTVIIEADTADNQGIRVGGHESESDDDNETTLL